MMGTLTRRERNARDDEAGMAVLRTAVLTPFVIVMVLAVLAWVSPAEYVEPENSMASTPGRVRVTAGCFYSVSGLLVLGVVVGMASARRNARRRKMIVRSADVAGEPVPAQRVPGMVGGHEATAAELEWVRQRQLERGASAAGNVDLDELRETNPVRAGMLALRAQKKARRQEMRNAGLTDETIAMLEHHRVAKRLGWRGRGVK